jgi:hypothetical protein
LLLQSCQPPSWASLQQLQQQRWQQRQRPGAGVPPDSLSAAAGAAHAGQVRPPAHTTWLVHSSLLC